MKTVRPIISHIAFAGRTFPSGHVSQDFTYPSQILPNTLTRSTKIKIRTVMGQLNNSRMFLRG